MNRKERREILKGQGNPVEFFCKVGNKAIPGLFSQIEDFTDPRHTSYIIYPQKVMIATALMKNVCGITSMTQMTEKFNDETIIKNIGILCEMQETLEELPHFVTINNYLSNLDPKHLEQIRMQQVKNLIKGRAYEAARLEGKWFVIIDATEICSFEEKNDEFCLHKTYNRGTENEKTIWSHSVLEAKIVLGDHFVISIGSEYIENNAEDEKRQEEMGAEAIKQDCEIKAFRRLAERLKKEFPHLPICIMGDSLYATETLFAICEKYHWDYIIRLKDGAMPAVAKEFHQLKDREPENSYRGRKWVNGIASQERTVNVMEWDDDGKMFQWVTNKEISRDNVVKYSKAGRKRWKIENEGFNSQKNHRFDMEHICCHNYTAIKNHYMLIQIADTLRQLYELKAYINRGLKVSIKNISSSLLSSFRTLITREDIFAAKQKATNAFS